MWIGARTDAAPDQHVGIQVRRVSPSRGEVTARAGGLDVLRFAPRDKIIVLGLLNVRDPELESQTDIMRTIDSASKYVPLENLALSANCGFSGAAAMSWINEEQERRKLELLVDTVEKVWGSAVTT